MVDKDLSVDNTTEFDNWLESIVLVNADGSPIQPELVADNDIGEDGEEE